MLIFFQATTTGMEQPISVTITQTLDVGSIRSVKVASKKNIPKAFEIFTDDRTFVLKAKDSSNAQEWIQCLSVARAHTQAKDSNLKKLAYGGSLGRLNHHHGRPPLHHSSLNHNLATLRTAVWKHIMKIFCIFIHTYNYSNKWNCYCCFW